jgi:hypothetical protein
LSKSDQEDILRIDPLAMNLVNRLAPGTIARGAQAFQGGLLLQGQWLGGGLVRGSLVVWHDALLVGRFRVEGDLYVFGQLGSDGVEAIETYIECHGTTYMAQSARSSASVLTVGLRLYDGADISGIIKTMKGQRSKGLGAGPL